MIGRATRDEVVQMRLCVMRSVPPRGSGWVVSRLVIKVRQVIALTVHYVVDCSGNALFVP